MNINRVEKTPAITPEELFALPGDLPPEPAHVMTEEEYDAIIARMSTYDDDIARANAAAREKAEAAKAAKAELLI